MYTVIQIRISQSFRYKFILVKNKKTDNQNLCAEEKMLPSQDGTQKEMKTLTIHLKKKL